MRFGPGVRLLALVVMALARLSDSSGDTFEKEMKTLQKTIGALSRQMMMQQMFVEERIRSDGNSGVKQVRQNYQGTRNYFTEGHSSPYQLLAIHEHANNDRTVGMGEFIGVLNGVEFRTRHNDYRLNMPHATSTTFHKIQPIPFPDVPPEVTSKATVDEQIVEMREWFKAWKDQKYDVRDYRKYFKPVLCYLEGAWTVPSKDIDEPFESDRHFIDAKNWFDLQEKVRFTSYTGRKSNLENYSFLPTTIIDTINDTFPVFAQWNYRILCHPLSRDVPLNRFRVVDELAPRMAFRRPLKEQAAFRTARFQLNPYDNSRWGDRIDHRRWSLVDELMSEIPGKDNYQGNITDDAFDLTAYSMNPKDPGKLNAAYYHRWFKVTARGAMGLSRRHRGFNDENVFMALTNQPGVAGVKLNTCQKSGKVEVCKEVNQKVSYAVPLELIYMTPLSKWNPFDLEYKGEERHALGKTVYAGGRNGGKTVDKAYNGTNSRKYYQTPSAFFTGGEVSGDAADTAKNTVGVLDKNEVVRITRPSGTRIFLPSIPGVGILRQRYPIMPVHGEGMSVWKECEAMKDVLLQSKTFGMMYKEAKGTSSVPTSPPEKDLTLKLQDARRTPPGPHSHEIRLSGAEVKLAKTMGKIHTKTTTTTAGHQHDIKFQWKSGLGWFISYCDGRDTADTKCWDQHGTSLDIVTNA